MGLLKAKETAGIAGEPYPLMKFGRCFFVNLSVSDSLRYRRMIATCFPSQCDIASRRIAPNAWGMIFAKPISTAATIALSLFATGCSKSDSTPAASAPPAPQTVKSTPATVEVGTLAQRPVEITIPNLSQTSADQLAQLGSQSLSNLAILGGEKSSGITDQITSLRSSLDGNQAVDALNKLKQLSDVAQSIPGAPIVIEGTKQLVSAWALKQGFDPSTITPVLAAIQQKDYASLASQAAILVGTGGLTAEQKQIVNGVLTNYGIDAKVDQALDAVKGLFNR